MKRVAHYLLDTNVVSEMMRKVPDHQVLDFVDTAHEKGLAISSITVWEIRNGLSLLSPGQKRRDLEQRFGALIDELFEDRVVPIDRIVAEACAVRMEERRRAGRSLDAHLPDAIIAASAQCHELVLATRNVKDFEGAGIELVDPWSDIGRH